MSEKKNPLKLNKLQLRTLVLAQVLAKTPGMNEIVSQAGDAKLLQLPHAHGDHVHIGGFTVSAREASGFSNPAVWIALVRKGLAKTDGPTTITITAAGLQYDTGLGERFLAASDH
jgi:hypothetical protein